MELNMQEHSLCPQCNMYDRLAIEVREITKTYPFEEQSVQYRIIFQLEGSLECYSENVIHEESEAGQILLLPPGKQFRLLTPDKARVLIIRLEETISFCECCLGKNLSHQEEVIYRDGEKDRRSLFFLLEMNSTLLIYAQGLAACVEKGLRCKYYFKIKTRELSHLFGTFYTKQELALFFREMLHSDAHFYY